MESFKFRKISDRFYDENKELLITFFSIGIEQAEIQSSFRPLGDNNNWRHVIAIHAIDEKFSDQNLKNLRVFLRKFGAHNTANELELLEMQGELNKLLGQKTALEIAETNKVFIDRKDIDVLPNSETLTISVPMQSDEVNPKIVRTKIVKLSQSEFAETYHLNLRTIQSWEASKTAKNHTIPSKAAITFLKLIAADHRWVANTLSNASSTKLNIEEIWKKTNFEQDEFCFIFNIGYSYLGRWINEKVKPSGPALALLKLIDADHKKVLNLLHNQKKPSIYSSANLPKPTPP